MRQMYGIRITTSHDHFGPLKCAHFSAQLIMGTVEDCAKRAADNLQHGQRGMADCYADKADALRAQTGSTTYLPTSCFKPDCELTWQATLTREGECDALADPYWYAMSYKIDCYADNVAAMRWIIGRVEAAKKTVKGD
ncbi:unnamed protein product, partial [marine sediment metagenome]